MICKTCHGVGLLNEPAECWAGCNDPQCPYIHTPGVVPCRSCGGAGLQHCCEGDRACPDTPVDASTGMAEKEP